MTAIASDHPVAASCPLCHTPGPTVTDAQFSPDWRCAVCHQSWTATRLATVAAYAEFVKSRGGKS